MRDRPAPLKMGKSDRKVPAPLRRGGNRRAQFKMGKSERKFDWRGQSKPVKLSTDPDIGRKMTWRPKRDMWQGNLTDDLPGFGQLWPGNGVEVFVETSRNPEVRSKRMWVDGVVISVDKERSRVAVNLGKPRKGVVEVRQGFGFLRREEDDRANCSEEFLAEISYHRVHGSTGEVKQIFSDLPRDAPVGHITTVVMTLCRMGEVNEMHELLQKHPRAIASIAKREMAHAFALKGKIQNAVEYVTAVAREPEGKKKAAQLLVEVLAIALTATIAQEKRRLGINFLAGVETNPIVIEVAEETENALTLLKKYADEVFNTPPSLSSRAGLTEAFNELLMSCGRAHRVPLSFRVLEWMEVMGIPKNSFTYEAIGLNTVKRVSLLKSVWDLPTAPEESVPEIVFAGRSNVGKSSLVNMLLSKVALAPTSSKPGKTRTMDFFDVNAGHPALPRFRLVDVPGLGFARASKDMRMRWISLIGGYFIQRKTLKVVYHLLDASLGEILPADRDLWKLLAQARRTDFDLCIVLTKADNTLPVHIDRFAQKIREALRAEGSDLAMTATIFACSSKSKLGKDTLWRKIWSVVDTTEGPLDFVRGQSAEHSDDEEDTSLSEARESSEILPPVLA